MSALHNVVRQLVRGQGHASPAIERDLLLSIDADEQGYPDLESYKEVLAQKAREEAAALQAQVSGPSEPADVTAALSDEQLAAELDRRKALQAAQAGAGVQRAGSPIPTS